jgi:hypothetical protein
MKKLLLFILVISTIDYGCEKNSVTIPQSLAGEWSWIRTCGGIYYNCSTPESTHQNIRTVYTQDSFYNYYQNDTLKQSVRFNIYIIKSQDGKDRQMVDYVTFGFNPNALYYSIVRDTLSLWNGDLDGLTSYFKRLK